MTRGPSAFIPEKEVSLSVLKYIKCDKKIIVPKYISIFNMEVNMCFALVPYLCQKTTKIHSFQFHSKVCVYNNLLLILELGSTARLGTYFSIFDFKYNF